MTKCQFGFIVTLLLLSVAFIVAPLVVFLIRRTVIKPSFESKSKSGVSRMLLFSACLVGSVWCLRYAVGYYGVLFPAFSTVASGAAFEGLTQWEEVFNSMVHAIQTFSMDEDYTAYIISGKTMLREMFGAQSTWETAYGIYAAVLNIIAPIAGGAVLFEILASIFPKIRLAISNFAIWREKYYFSELNDASLALAKSIIFASDDSCFLKRIIKAIRRPIIIFTDAYMDDEDEKESELLLEAKMLGTITVRDDLSHVMKNKCGMRKFFLIDENELGNLQALTALANSNNCRYLKKAEVYLFTNDDAYVQVEKSVRDKLMGKWNLDSNSDRLPLIIPVQSYRNFITNLLVDVPLYEPLISKKKNGDSWDLTVSILGSGHIGIEMFLSTYWFGQILNCSLRINIISQEDEEDFWNKIDYINPEIMHTTIDGDEILTFYKRGDDVHKSPIYCDVKYYQCDVKSSKFIKSLNEGDRSILDTDYFLVSLGSDEENISVANTVKRFVGKHHIEVAEKEFRESKRITSPNKTVVAYVVYDSELADTLNRKMHYRFVDSAVDVYMRAVGSLREVYSVRNVFMTNHEEAAQSAHEAYVAINDREARAKAHRKRMKDDYKHWATLSQSMHALYRVFASNIELPSILEINDNEEILKNDKEAARAYKEFKEKIEVAKSVYRDMVTGTTRWPNDMERVGLLHKLAWMEHRRWNAFTRVKGFMSTKSYDAYYPVTRSYKEMNVKLHPCLSECDQNGIKVLSDENRCIGIGPIFLSSDDADRDCIDELSYDLREKEYNDYDFKLYDYPMIVQTILDSIELPDDFDKAAKQTAKNIHEEWRQKRLKAGWTYGAKFNTDKKLDPRIAPFEELSENDLNDVLYAPVTQYKIAYALGYKIRFE